MPATKRDGTITEAVEQFKVLLREAKARMTSTTYRALLMEIEDEAADRLCREEAKLTAKDA